MKKTLEERFWAKVDKNGPVPAHCPELGNCWVWTNAKHDFGYGKIWASASYPEDAQRVSWKLAYGPIPPGMYVLHRCDNPPCVRPEHLFLGTHKENMQDMTAKGRHGVFDRAGEKNGNAKLTEAQVVEIRERAAAGERGLTLAAEYGLHFNKISAILHGRSWVNAGGPIRKPGKRGYHECTDYSSRTPDS